MNLDKNTFGKSKAAEVLIKILNEIGDVRLGRRVAQLFTQFSQGVHAIDDGILECKMRRSLLELWCSKSKERALMADIPEKVRSYLMNIEHAMMCEMRKAE